MPRPSKKEENVVPPGPHCGGCLLVINELKKCECGTLLCEACMAEHEEDRDIRNYHERMLCFHTPPLPPLTDRK
jgi:hypothetical protein